MDEQTTEEIIQEVSAETTAAASTETPTATPTAPSDWRQGFQWEIDYNGQKISPDSADKAKTWLSLGHNYSQRAAELNRERATWQKEREELATKYKSYDRFANLDEYARQNPEWWKHVEQSWEQRGSFNVDPNLKPVLEPVLNRLQQTESFLQQLQQERAQAQLKEEDQALESEIGEIRKQHPNIDLSAADETGRSLEYRILAHANQTGIKSFRAAFRDYLHDKLVEDSVAQRLTQQAKEKEQKAKAGILGTTPAPTKTVNRAQNLRGQSYDALAQEALRELGLNN